MTRWAGWMDGELPTQAELSIRSKIGEIAGHFDGRS